MFPFSLPAAAAAAMVTVALAAALPNVAHADSATFTDPVGDVRSTAFDSTRVHYSHTQHRVGMRLTMPDLGRRTLASIPHECDDRRGSWVPGTGILHVSVLGPVGRNIR